MKITWFGTTTLLFDDGRDQLMFDCHVTRPSIPRYLFGRLRTDRALVDGLIQRYKIERLRAIFISHTHHDHVMDAPYFAWKCGAEIHGTTSALNVALGGHVPESRLRPFGDPVSIGRFRVTAVPSRHSRPTPFNNDLGKIIRQPLSQPARGRSYREGGSYDFVVAHEDRRYVIRPSFSTVEGQYDGQRADALFLGINGLSRASDAEKSRFFAETVDQLRPRIVIPIHWDNFFSPLSRPVRGMPRLLEDSGESMRLLAEHCGTRDIGCLVQLPLSFVEI